MAQILLLWLGRSHKYDLHTHRRQDYFLAEYVTIYTPPWPLPGNAGLRLFTSPTLNTTNSLGWRVKLQGPLVGRKKQSCFLWNVCTWVKTRSERVPSSVEELYRDMRCVTARAPSIGAQIWFLSRSLETRKGCIYKPQPCIWLLTSPSLSLIFQGDFFFFFFLSLP